MLATPLNQGSMLADRPSSDSARLKPRVPGPISASGGNGTLRMRKPCGSREVRVYRPERISETAGLKPVPAVAVPGTAVPKGEGAAGAAACTGGGEEAGGGA